MILIQITNERLTNILDAESESVDLTSLRIVKRERGGAARGPYMGLRPQTDLSIEVIL